MNTCCLCSSLSQRDVAELWNKPLFESHNFVVLPSIGSLVEGWLLLIPKDHYVSMGTLPTSLVAEMEAMKTAISAQLTERYGAIVIFEHGPASEGKHVGCSVDHAHLHFVPFSLDLRAAAQPFIPADSVWSAASWLDCQEATKANSDYLYLEQPQGNGFIAMHHNFGSQVFRKAIALSIGRPTEYQWRVYPEHETVAKTIKAMAPLAPGRNTLMEVFSLER